MIGLAEFSAALTSLQAAASIVQGLNAANTQVAINDAKIALQAQIFEAHAVLLAAQQSQLSLSKSISDLEQEVVRLKQWEAEKQRYQLQDVGQGSLAYTPKQGMENSEPPHSLCANCYTKGKKTILQRRQHVVGRAVTLDCHECKTSLVIIGVLRG